MGKSNMITDDQMWLFDSAEEDPLCQSTKKQWIMNGGCQCSAVGILVEQLKFTNHKLRIITK